MEIISYPSETRMNTNINNLLYMNDENKIIIYQDDNEITRISVRFADEDLWLT
mgnify:CR=1 FL=1